MYNGLYIDTEQLDLIKQSIDNSKKELNNLIEKQRELKEKMHEAWGGTCGDEAYQRLKKYEKKYDVYLDMLSKRIMFLESVIKCYDAWDKDINNKIDENVLKVE